MLSFTDKEGRVVLSRALNVQETLDTYYVYNDLGSLCFVLPPLATSNLTASAQAVLDKYAYQYRYDYRQRCTGKKLPGCAWVDMVYDHNNRLVFSRDGEQQKRGECSFRLTDLLGREVLSGVYQGALPDRNTCDASDIYATFSPSSSGAREGYLVHCPSGVTAANFKVLQANYYDTYTFALPASLNYAEDTGYGKRYTANPTVHCKDLLTGSMTMALGAEQKLYAAYYYDYDRNLIQERHSMLNGKTVVTKSAFNFSGQPVKTSEEYDAQTSIRKSYTYDHMGRMTREVHTIGTDNTTFVYNYDLQSRIIRQTRIHGTDSLGTTHQYNIRSWIKDIQSPHFSETLYYTDGNGTASYNGNISSMMWKVKDNVMRGYKFSYDGVNRMKDALYGEGTYISTNANRFTEKVTAYDKNGNINGLQRYGQTSASAYGLIDNLTYSYTNGNQLNRVDDAVTASAYNSGFEFKDKVKQAGEYTYDTNGNLTKDLNKGISSIQYNILNLPSVVTFGDGSITYTYAADGTKLRTVHKTGSTATTTDYCGNAVYEGTTAKLLLTGQGYVSLSDKKYHYYLKDHQGNNRVVVNQAGTVEETNHYYPFGGVFANTGNTQPYKYNGKELDAKKGLNWYDYGARHYDAAVGRFMTVDPLAEKYYPMSPYAYCASNPVRFIDIDGQKKVIYNPDGTYKETTHNNWFHNTFVGRQEYISYGDREVQLSEQEFWDWQRTGNYGSIQATDAVTDIEFKLDEPATSIADGVAKFVLSSVYSLANSPKVVLTGRTWSGTSQTSTERLGSFIDVITNNIPFSKFSKIGNPGSWYKFKRSNSHIPISKKKEIYDAIMEGYIEKTKNIDAFSKEKSVIDIIDYTNNQQKKEE